MNDWGTRAVDFEFLVDSGLLFEINRLILHPVGLALAMKRSPEGKLVLAEQLKDSRNEPEQLFFDEAAFDTGRRKWAEFKEWAFKQAARRRKKLGWDTQDFIGQGKRAKTAVAP